jgi:uncharacterized membrane protein (DUF106 family)
MGKVMLVCVAAMMALMVVMLVDRYRLERLRHEVDELRLSAEARAADSNSVFTKGAV